ncbi:asparagine synthase-related protein [Erythrobacter mangrovi]|uniref:Asparagine synthetase domain-containing protein n=1 Tax=Erythrobacter mangrovi TaxID=2739433 RepID=A0A7D3XQY6_9SPHN|nr:asparagine synthase-related protein [Erythrobacter mangrovi]QKG70831.1 hypothetical protein HQR01_05290 [Erythrobacter mangrovi]
MLAAWSNRGGAVRRQPILAALSAYSGDRPALVADSFGSIATCRPGQRSPPVDAPTPYADGILAFTGWLDRAPDRHQTDTQCYAQALERYGSDADDRLSGAYAAATLYPDGRLRLSRSPWQAPPLHYAAHLGEVIASSVLRALFAFGIPRTLDRTRVLNALYLDGAGDPTAGWYCGVRSVPLGTSLIVSPDGSVEIQRQYDPFRAYVDVGKDPAQWVAEARSLIDDHARLAASRSQHPAISLSGGLDSPIAAAALLRTKPATAPLSVISVRPSRSWDMVTEPGKFGDEGSRAEEFCAMHGLTAVFTHEGGFDLDLQDLHRASAITSPFIGNGGMIMAAYRAAAAAGADWFFDAVSGNDTISAEGHWAYPAMLASGRWRQLLAALRQRSNDPRGLARKFVSLALMPHLPVGARNTLKVRFSRGAGSVADRSSLLKRAVIADFGLATAASQRQTATGRRRMIELAWAASDSGMADLELGREQLTGLRRRDLLAYRPLIEFCLSLPDEAFLRDGTDRWLARELARGIMPESQRRETRYGGHNVDWHSYLVARREELLETFDGLSTHPWLGEWIDVERARGLLDALPNRTPLDPATAWPLQFGIVGTAAIARFVAQVEGRNAL